MIRLKPEPPSVPTSRDILIKDVPGEVLDGLEALRAKRGLRSRAELIRALLEEALKP